MLSKIVDGLGSPASLERLAECNISGFVVNGSGAYLIDPYPSLIPRLPRDLDLVAIGYSGDQANTPNILLETLSEAAKPHNIRIRKIAKDSGSVGARIARLVNKKEKFCASLTLDTGETVEAEIETLLSNYIPDMPPHQPDGTLSNSGMLIGNMHLNFLCKIGSVNIKLRDQEARYTDMIDAYNWYHQITGGKGFSKADKEVFEYIIHHGKNYGKWRKTHKMHAVGRALLSFIIHDISSFKLLSHYHRVTMPAPSHDVIAAFYEFIMEMTKSGIIGKEISLKEAGEIYQLNYELSQQIFDHD